MPLFRKKPVVIEARQFTGSNNFEILRFIGRPQDIIALGVILLAIIILVLLGRI